MSSGNLQRRAFTLVEVMLAIAIFSIVLAAIYGTWRAIIGATQAGQIASAEVQRRRIALRCLEESLTFSEMFVANLERYYWFEAKNGTDASLSFVANLPKDFPRSGRFGDFTLRRVKFSIESGEEGDRQLVLRQAPLLMDFDEDELNYPLVLMKNVKRLEMEFWDLQKQDWTDEWTETNQMPKLLRIALTTENPKRPFDRGEEYTQIIAPASMAVQAAWQGRNPAQAGANQRRGLSVPPPVRR